MQDMTINEADKALIPKDLLAEIEGRWQEGSIHWKNREPVWHTDYNITDHPIRGEHGKYPHINVMHNSYNIEIRINP
jgi:hypothetical protein